MEPLALSAAAVDVWTSPVACHMAREFARPLGLPADPAGHEKQRAEAERHRLTSFHGDTSLRAG